VPSKTCKDVAVGAITTLRLFPDGSACLITWHERKPGDLATDQSIYLIPEDVADLRAALNAEAKHVSDGGRQGGPAAG
jgi:hypothetical protein